MIKLIKKIYSKNKSVINGTILFFLVLFCYEFFVPPKIFSKEFFTYEAQKGKGDEEISSELEKLGIINNDYFFRIYVIISGRHGKLQAGKYSFSPRMSVARIVKKLAEGDVIKEKILIYEGWDLVDIKKYFIEKGICQDKTFLDAVGKYYDFDFLRDKPKDQDLEGYIFPDTYEVSGSDTCEEAILKTLSNFDKKLTPELRNEIVKQKKTIFEIITMASIIEKEVKKPEDKKIVSGILWKRIEGDMPLQVDSTINYITGKNHAGVLIKDTKIDSPYNTYKYYGLPKGPISNPGMDSILAAIYPKASPYWYYLSANGTGKTIFSRTLQEHALARAKYLD
jgi:UPF0755 protein